MSSLTPDEITALLELLPQLSPEEQAQVAADLDAYDHAQTLQRARDDFLAFCRYIYPGFKEGPHHRHLQPVLHNVLIGAELRVTVSMPPRFGKQLDHDTPVMTHNRGWVRHGDLAVGDKVFHPSGRPVAVLALSPETQQDCEVEFQDGAVLRCHERHEWTVYDRANARWRTVETQFLERQALLAGGRSRFQLPPVAALQFPEAQLPLDPYFLGAWLGDGRASATDICGTEADLEHITARIPYARGARWRHKDTGVVTQNFLGVRGTMVRMGVLGNKHIPAAYLQASEAQRRALLAGLVDTDGTQSKDGRMHFCGNNRRMVEEVAQLTRSLGYRTGVIEVPPDTRERTISGGAHWRCSWTPHDGQGGGTLARKTAWRVRARRQIGVKAVRRVAPSTGRCIQVDSPDGLYLAGTHFTPTHNSETIAYLFVAWYLGHNPKHHIMMATHTADLSASFGRKVRNLLDTPEYSELFPGTVVSRDKSAADNWTTTAGGKYLAIGVGGNVAGHGAHLLIADDLISEQAILTGNSDTAFETAWSYMQVGPLQRLMPGGRIVMIGTRWGKKDPIGRALRWAEENPGSLKWNEIRFPAIMEVVRKGESKTVSLWPEQWPVEQLLAKKAGMQPQFWAAQYMQEPTSEEGALIKREWWQIWDKDEPPKCHFVLQTWDTAHDTKSHNDYSACATWGVWFNEVTNRDELILLNAFKERMEFPELKRAAMQHYKDWEPDCVIIEKKAAGAPLIQELRSVGLFIEEVSPSRGTRMVSNDKYARVNAIAPVFQDKAVWAPDRRWAREVIEDCAAFPNGEHDDLVDVTEMAVARFRRGGFISLTSDHKDDNELLRGGPRKRAYY